MSSSTKTYQAGLRDTVLRTPGEKNLSRVAVSGIGRQEVVLRLPDSATVEEKYDWFCFLVAAGTSTETSREKWRTFVLSLVALAFPDVHKQMMADAPRLYKVTQVPVETMTKIKEFLVVCATWAETPVTDVADREAGRMEAAKTLPVEEHLPATTSAALHPLFAQCRTIEALFGYTSLVLFLAGKSITDRNRGAITTKRPSAIERKYNLGSVPCLSGDLKMSNVAHDYIHTAFVSMNHARKQIFTEVAKFSNETGDVGMEVAAVTTRLMAYSGMQHVILIDKFLSGEPDAELIPMLASSLVSYSASLVELSKTAVELRPFFKLIHGDTTQAFNRKNVEPLMVVAIKAEAEVQPTLNNYNLPENAPEILAAYLNYKKRLAEE